MVKRKLNITAMKVLSKVPVTFMKTLKEALNHFLWYMFLCAIHIMANKLSLTTNLCALIKSNLIMPSFIRYIRNKSTDYINGDIVKDLLGTKY